MLRLRLKRERASESAPAKKARTAPRKYILRDAYDEQRQSGLMNLGMDVLERICEHLEADGSLFSFVFTCYYAYLVANSCGKLFRRLGNTHIMEMFRVGHRDLVCWAAARLGARFDMGAMVRIAARAGQAHMFSDGALRMPIELRRSVLAIGIEKRHEGVVKAVLRDADSELLRHAAAHAVVNGKKNVIGMCIASHPEFLEYLGRHDGVWSVLERAGRSSTVRWLSDTYGLTPDLDACLSWATKRLDEAHLFWAIRKGAQPIPTVYFRWAIGGRLDVVRRMDVLTNGLSQRMDPELFVHPLAREYLTAKRIDLIEELHRMYGAAALPDWALLKLSDHLYGAIDFAARAPCAAAPLRSRSRLCA